MANEARDELAVLRRLREVTALLGVEHDPERLVPLVLDQAIALVGAERGFVVLLGPGGELTVPAARNLDREAIARPEHQVSRSVIQRVVQRGQGEVVLDAQGEASLRAATSVRVQELRSILCAPLRVGGQTIGVVYLDHRHVPGRFGPPDLATLEAFAVPAAVAIDAARRTAQLRRQGEELVQRVATIERLRAELAARYRERSREADRLRDEAARAAPLVGDELPGLIARSPAMRRVVALVRKVAASDAPVLIHGESGTGKELVARAIHALSGRRGGPFVAENCAALADPLLESELFGHERGAFTGAVQAHAGLFEQARGGTLFLDEVGDMSPALQPKLLRVLQEGELRRVGGSGKIGTDARVVTATHRDLEALVAEGRFRADLYYRLAVVRIELPPLRERVEDLGALLDAFLARHGGPTAPHLEPQARELLLAHSWPGNVRELENEVRRLIVLAGPGGAIRPALLSPAVLGAFAPRGPAAPRTADPDEVPLLGVVRLEEAERELVRRALRAAGGSKAQAARLLGLPKSSLYHRLEKLGLSAKEDDPARGNAPRAGSEDEGGD